ncbi:GNAT family N-acetyltransferase [Streptomyces sp. NBRC 109706]|uniref:GNAT family N-acetyltransferase n=1 Tax=Streptomyces sp. NBRC 109706 TaxID=1550035 RepID=UPI0007853906|nr:GNAT family N-acetyltransferase [Streptomyces sp. NBRC 109706]
MDPKDDDAPAPTLPPLTGELVRLRPMEPADARDLWRWHSDPEVVRWLDVEPPQSLARTEARFAEPRTNTFEKTLLMIERRADGRLIGVCGLRDASPESGRAELDIYIGEKDCWSQGYGTDAVRALCRWGFDRMRLHLIALWVVAENERAVRAYEKVGFAVDGRHRECFRGAGRWHDMLLMSLLEGELR